MLQTTQLSRPAGYSIHFGLKLTPSHYGKLQAVARHLGVSESAALRACLDAVSVSDEPAADHAASMQDVENEEFN